MVFAWRGVLRTVVRQRNMRLHLLASALVAVASNALTLSLGETFALLWCIAIVWSTELFNSAIEHVVDLVSLERRAHAEAAKDAAAAGVLIPAVVSVLVFASLLASHAAELASRQRLISELSVVGFVAVLTMGSLLNLRHPMGIVRWALGAAGLSAAVAVGFIGTSIPFAVLLALLVVVAFAQGTFTEQTKP